MEKPIIVKLHPARLDESVQSPVLTGLLEKGWTIGTTLILQDPTKQPGDDTRIGLLMLPPVALHDARGGVRGPGWAPDPWRVATAVTGAAVLVLWALLVVW